MRKKLNMTEDSSLKAFVYISLRNDERERKKKCHRQHTINSWALEYTLITCHEHLTKNQIAPVQKKTQIIIGNLFLLIWHTYNHISIANTMKKLYARDVCLSHSGREREWRRKNTLKWWATIKWQCFETENLLLISCASSVDGVHLKLLRKLACKQLFYSLRPEI